METKTKQILDTLQKKRIEFLRSIANVIDLSPEDIVEILPPIRLQIVVSEDSQKKESNIKRGPGRPKKKITPTDNLICQAMVKPRPNKKKETPCRHRARPGSLFCGKHQPKDGSGKRPAATSTSASIGEVNSNHKQPEKHFNTICEVYHQEIIPNIDFRPTTPEHIKQVKFRGQYYFYDQASTSLYQYTDERCHYIGYLKNGDIIRQ